MPMRLLAIAFASLTLSTSILADVPEWFGISSDLTGQTSDRWFSGVSGNYFDIGSESQKNARDEACRAAMNEVAKFFGYKVEVKEQIETVATGETIYEQEARGDTEIKLFGLQPDKIVTEKLDSGEFRVYCLVTLEPSAEDRIRAQLDDNKIKYEKNIKAFEDALIAKDIDKASVIKATLDGFPSLNKDKRLTSLSKRYYEIKRKALSVVVALDRPDYAPGDEVGVTLDVSHDAYLYVFMDSGFDWTLLYPNSSYVLAKVNRGQVVIPDNRMINNNLMPYIYSDSQQERVEVRAVLSQKIMTVDKYLHDSGLFSSLDYHSPWHQLVDRCVQERTCVISSINKPVKDPIRDVVLNIVVRGDPSYARMIMTSFNDEGVKTADSGEFFLNLSFDLQEGYSSRLDIDLQKVVLKGTLRYGDQHQTINVTQQGIKGRDINILKASAAQKLVQESKSALVRLLALSR